MTRWQDDKMTILQYYKLQGDKMTRWQNEKIRRRQDYKMTRWQIHKMTSWQDDKRKRWLETYIFFYFKPSLNSKLCLADSLIHSLTHKAPNLYLFYSTQFSHLWALDHGSWIMWKQLRQICQEPFDSCR